MLPHELWGNRNAVHDLHRRRLQNTRCSVQRLWRKCTATVSGAGTNDVNGNYVEANNMLDPTGGSCVMVKENCGGTGRVRYSILAGTVADHLLAVIEPSRVLLHRKFDPASMSTPDTWMKGPVGATTSYGAGLVQQPHSTVILRCSCSTIHQCGCWNSLWVLSRFRLPVHRHWQWSRHKPLDKVIHRGTDLVPSDGACMWEQNCNGEVWT